MRQLTRVKSAVRSKICRHCGRGPVNRPRGLCWTCYYTAAIRSRYPSISKFGRRGVDDFFGRAALPSTPTEASPGSPEKVAILEQRARQRQALWHPNDAPMDLESFRPMRLLRVVLPRMH